MGEALAHYFSRNLRVPLHDYRYQLAGALHDYRYPSWLLSFIREGANLMQPKLEGECSSGRWALKDRIRSLCSKPKTVPRV